MWLVNYKLAVLAILIFMLTVDPIFKENFLFSLISPRWWDAHEPQVEGNGMDFTEAVTNYSL